MTPFDVLSMIREAGGRVSVLDGDLRVIAPPGTLTPEAAVVLREHKAALIGILPDAEREAIGWVEDLDPAAAEIVVSTARREWNEIVGDPDHDLNAWAAAQLGQVSHSAPTLLEQNIGSDQDEEAIPCSTCGSLMAWWDATGRRHCMVCEPIDRSQQLAKDAARLRAKPTLTFKVKGRAAKPVPAPWPPAEYALPGTLQAIERGRQEQRELFVEAVDDSRAARLARVLADVEGIRTADTMELRT
jgi:hypothetical protein